MTRKITDKEEISTGKKETKKRKGQREKKIKKKERKHRTIKQNIAKDDKIGNK